MEVELEIEIEMDAQQSCGMWHVLVPLAVWQHCEHRRCRPQPQFALAAVKRSEAAANLWRRPLTRQRRLLCNNLSIF